VTDTGRDGLHRLTLFMMFSQLLSAFMRPYIFALLLVFMG